MVHIIEQINRICNVWETVRGASPASNTGNEAKPVIQVFSFFEVTMAVTGWSGCTKILSQSYFGKIFKQATVPSPDSFTLFQSQIRIVFNVKAVACWANQYARSAGQALL